MPIKNYNDFHKNPKIQYKPIKKNNFTYRTILKIIFSCLDWNNKKSIRILDYGCGVGTVDFYLAKSGYKVHGIDISPVSIDSCRKSAKSMNLKNISFSIDVKNFGTSKYTMVICSEVIEHLPNDSKVLEELAGSLVKGGKLVLSTPSINAPIFRLGMANDFDKRVGHLRRYDVENLTDKITSAGLEIRKVVKTEGIIRNSLFLLPSLAWIIRFLKGPLSDLVTFLDDITVPLFGESNFIVIAQKP